jgi:fumarate hydratase subunit beta
MKNTQGVIHVKAPLTDDIIKQLRAGNRVLVSGVLYTARDAAHKRFIETLQSGEALPIDINRQIIYYVGPSPAIPGKPIGSAGPTTSYRMDTYTVDLLEKGLKGMIGKGIRSEAVREAIKEFKAVYFAAIGGAGALIAGCVKSAKVVAYANLGPEAVQRLIVRNFPVIVANDAFGGDIYKIREKNI